MTELAVTGLTVAYGRTEAVCGIDLRVPSGQVVCLIGANGAGKTTTMRALSGLLRPRAGRVVFGGRDIAGLAAHRVAAAGLLHVPEGRQAGRSGPPLLRSAGAPPVWKGSRYSPLRRAWATQE